MKFPVLSSKWHKIEPGSPCAGKSSRRIANGLIKAIAVASGYLAVVQFPVQASVGPIGLAEDISVAISPDKNEARGSCINGTDLFFSEHQFGWKTIRTFFPESRTCCCRIIRTAGWDVHMNESIWRHGKDWIKTAIVDRRVSNVLVGQSDHQALPLFWDSDIAKLCQNVWPELSSLLIIGDRKLLPSNPENSESLTVYIHTPTATVLSHLVFARLWRSASALLRLYSSTKALNAMSHASGSIGVVR